MSQFFDKERLKETLLIAGESLYNGYSISINFAINVGASRVKAKSVEINYLYNLYEFLFGFNRLTKEEKLIAVAFMITVLNEF
jgi:hypothetical protein